MLLLIATYHILFNMAEGMPLYVTPNITTNKCYNQTPCLELNTYVQNASSYFLSNAQFIFLPGTHFLDSQVMIDSKENFQMIGSPNLTQYPISVKVHEYGFDPYDEDNTVTYFESLSYITCTTYNNSGFVFVNITNLTISNITFANCGAYSNTTNQSASILAMNIYNLQMEGVSIQNGTGYGFWGVNLLGHSQIIQSSFIGNNQFIKNGLLNTSAVHFKCNGKAYSRNTLYYGNGDTTLAGGNMVIVYNDDGNYTEDSELNLRALVVSLGIDAYFNYDTQCQGNFQGTGLSLLLFQTFYINITIQNSTFYRNQAWCGGNIYFSDHSVNFDISLENVFVIRAMVGFGSLYIDYEAPQTPVQVPSILHMQYVNFECNYAVEDGSSFDMEIYGKLFPTNQTTLQISLENCVFRSDYSSSAAIEIELISSIMLTFSECVIADMLQTTSCAFDVLTEGLFTLSECIFTDSVIKIRSTKLCITNSTFYNSSIFAINATITLNGNNTFSSCTNRQNGGAISLISATIVFSPFSYVTFVNNSATYGGAIYMEWESFLNYSSPTNVTFINNAASLSGGAIYVVTPIPSQYYIMDCFYQFYGTFSKDSVADINVYFEGNVAREAGSAIYGGDIDHCRLDYCKECNIKVFDATHDFGHPENNTSLISSDPRYICPCDKYVFHSTSINRTAYPGEQIMVQFITIGQRKGISPGVVFTYTNNGTITSAFRSINQCNTYEISYTPISGNVFLSTEISSNSGEADSYHINISIVILPCPAGFVMDNSSSSCVCNPLLRTRYVYICNIQDQTLSKSGSAWIGNNSQGNLSVIEICPSDYCTNKSEIDVLHFDSQCSYNRLGVACGQCPGNLSMIFGSSLCKPCTNEYLLLMIPFAFMGIALIAFLMLSNLTASSGTINGILLYAFVVRVFKDIFFPTSHSNVAYANVLDFLSVFIAWFNLDFGIETCFYHGMDSYSKVWLQFSFLLFMIFLVVVIIVASRQSSIISKICRYNMVPVISTLAIMFYAKVLRITTIIFTYATIVSVSTKTSSLVWYYDPTIPYLGLKHAILFTAGLVVTIFFILPFTAVMLLTPCLVTKSHWKVLYWMNKLKPFIDCYEAPFKDRYRFWTGATLFHRIVLCIVFGFFSNNQPTTVLIIIIAIHASMIVMAGVALYKSWLVSLLDGFFHINIIILSLALFFLYNSSENETISTVPTAVCVGSAFVCFVCILLFRLFNTVWKKNYFNLVCLKYAALPSREDAATDTESVVNTDLNNEEVERNVYREPLSDDNT